MTVAAEADATEALSAPTTTAGTSKRFQWITSPPQWPQPNSFRLFNIVGNEGYMWHRASYHPAGAAKSVRLRDFDWPLGAAAINDEGS
jgi:hypothetical protein